MLVDGAGDPLGALPPFDVDLPYWQEVACVVRGARERYGVEVAVLRLLHAERAAPHGGRVTYLAQADGAPARYTGPVGADLSDHPNRCAYARPGGPAASLRWAATALAELGRGPLSSVEQQRTWNLSAIWRLGTPGGSVWLKQVPRFLAHEPAVLAWISATVDDVRVPSLLAAADGRMLLDDVPGDDLYGAGIDTRDAVAADMQLIQVSTAGRVAELLAAGVPDLRARPLTAWVTDVVTRYGTGDPRLAALAASLDALAAGLDRRLSAVAACGVPDTLVHGDLHPGNVRGDGRRRVLMDWGDSFVGHPAFDILRLTEGVDPAGADRLVAAWAARWRAAVPGCDPDTAMRLLRPVAALRAAAVYANFLANIEPSEQPYHADDVPACLTAALASA